MWTIVLTAIVGALKAIIGLGGKPAEPTAAELAASNATARSELAQQEATNEVVTQAAAARADADARIMLGDNGPTGGVNLDPAAPVNQSPDAHFRD